MAQPVGNVNAAEIARRRNFIILDLKMAQQPKFKVPAAPRRKIFAPEKVNRQRNLAIPGPIFWNMIRNPKYAVVTGKLNQTCKYVFWKGKIIPVSYMDIEGNSLAVQSDENEKKCYGVQTADLRKISCRFWLTKTFSHCGAAFDPNLFISRLYRSDLRVLALYAPVQLKVYQKLTVSSTLQSLTLSREIKNPDGSTATVDQILKPLSQLEKLRWCFGQNSYIETAQDVEHFGQAVTKLTKLVTLQLVNIPEDLFEAFVEFFKKNRTIDIWISFHHLTDNYKLMLANFMEEMIQNPIQKLPQFPNVHHGIDLVMKYRDLYMRQFIPNVQLKSIS